MRTIPKKLIDDGIYFVNYIVYSTELDTRKFMFIAVRKEDMATFREAVKSGSFDPDDHGVIIEEGDGEAPAIVKEKMKLLYSVTSNI